MFEVNKIRNDFPMIKNNPNLVYFDNAATSFKPQCVIDAVNDFYSTYTSNIHRGDYNISFKASTKFDEVREIVRKFINADRKEEIVFTSGATASLNMVAYCYGLANLSKDDVILTTLSEHASDVLPLFKVARMTGAKVSYIELNSDGTFNLDNYEKCFEESVKMVCLPHVSNVLGYINPIKDIVSIAHKHGAIVSVDGAQSVPHIKTNVKDSDVDFLSFSSHKMLGPSGVGVLYGKFDLLDSLDPINYGGGANSRFDLDGNIILQKTPLKFEAGTPNIEGVIAFGEAINYLNNLGMDNIEEYDLKLVKYFMDKIKVLDNVEVYNLQSDTGIVAFNIKGIFAQDAASYFNSLGFAVRTGNQCAKLIHNVIGSNEFIRASLYFYNTFDEIDRFIEVIKNTTLEKCVGVLI